MEVGHWCGDSQAWQRGLYEAQGLSLRLTTELYENSGHES